MFLDEIGDLSAQGQAMLLRFLQEREVRPLGSTSSVRLDVRVIAATNRDLAVAVEKGEFRADLYDRISDVVLAVPPLRERREDIIEIAESFVADYGRRHGVTVKGLSRQAGPALVAHDWPGNVRELEKAISRAVIFAEDKRIIPADLELPPVGVTPVSACSRVPLTRQEQIEAFTRACGSVRRSEVAARFGISGETARRELFALVRRGILERAGRHRGCRYSSLGRSGLRVQ